MAKLETRQVDILIGIVGFSAKLDRLIEAPYSAPEMARCDHGLLPSATEQMIVEALEETHCLDALHCTELFALYEATIIHDVTDVYVVEPLVEHWARFAVEREIKSRSISSSRRVTRAFRPTAESVTSLQSLMCNKRSCEALPRLEKEMRRREQDNYCRCKRPHIRSLDAAWRSEIDESVRWLEANACEWLSRANSDIIDTRLIYTLLHDEVRHLERLLPNQRDRWRQLGERARRRIRSVMLQLQPLMDWEAYPRLKYFIWLDGPVKPLRLTRLTELALKPVA